MQVDLTAWDRRRRADAVPRGSGTHVCQHDKVVRRRGEDGDVVRVILDELDVRDGLAAAILEAGGDAASIYSGNAVALRLQDVSV